MRLNSIQNSPTLAFKSNNKSNIDNVLTNAALGLSGLALGVSTVVTGVQTADRIINPPLRLTEIPAEKAEELIDISDRQLIDKTAGIYLKENPGIDVVQARQAAQNNFLTQGELKFSDRIAETLSNPGTKAYLGQVRERTGRTEVDLVNLALKRAGTTEGVAALGRRFETSPEVTPKYRTDEFVIVVPATAELSDRAVWGN